MMRYLKICNWFLHAAYLGDDDDDMSSVPCVTLSVFFVCLALSLYYIFFCLFFCIVRNWKMHF